jgi:hypothetical protein
MHVSNRESIRHSIAFSDFAIFEQYKLTLLNNKTDKYSNQNKLFSVHFQEMPGFKGKRNFRNSFGIPSRPTALPDFNETRAR